MALLTPEASRANLSLCCTKRAGLFALFLLLCLLLGKSSAQTPEYQLKAAFLFNFAQFTHFPTNTAGSTNTPFVIGILGDNPFGQVLHELVRGEKVQGRPIEVRVSRALREVQEAEILFLASPATERWPQIVQSLRGRPVLTVCEQENFAHRGGMIRLYSEGRKIRFDINPAAARESGLSFSSKLLRLATIVGPDATQ